MLCGLFSRRFATALFLPLFALAAAGARDGALLLCEMQGYTKTCCCPHQAQAQATTDSLEGASCCRPVDVVETSLPSTEHRQPLQSPAPSLTVAAAPFASRDLSALVAVAEGAPPIDPTPRSATGPPLFIKHRALLI